MAIKDAMYLILFLAILWLVWFLFGGPSRYNPNEGPLIKAPTEYQGSGISPSGDGF